MVRKRQISGRETGEGRKPALPCFVEFGREVCGNLRQAEAREWWLANGIGGYAAGTVAGTLTRRYHGLLVAPIHPPLGRALLVAKADATLIHGRHRWPLFANRWHNGVINPDGNIFIESFRLEGRIPVWRYAAGPFRLEMRIWMEPGANTSWTSYRLEPDTFLPQEGVELEVRLLVNCRDHHDGTERSLVEPALAIEGNRLRIAYPQGPVMFIVAHGGAISPERYWVENFDLPVERERGLPDADSHLCVGHSTLQMRPGEWCGLVYTLHGYEASSPTDSIHRFISHEAGILERAANSVPEIATAPEWISQLVLAADSFIIKRPVPGLPDGESVIAGYPWFGDWGRDTMIALPGLTLATGRFETARRILRTFARFVDRGMLPNVFPGVGDIPEYNTVDAALWYVEAWRAYAEASGDLESLKEAIPVLADIIESYRTGTRYGIMMDRDDSLLFAGEPGVQLTWMDAKVGDTVFTPRMGKAVEINALWYNAHRAMAGFAERTGLKGNEYAERAVNIRNGFRRFLNNANGGLFDVLDGPDGNDDTVRPNQILAVSLPYSPLDPPEQRGVVSLCRRRLHSSFGLRSLDTHHPEYRPAYRGGVWERDSSYHQGPVWGWLLGHQAMAEYRVHGDAALAQALLDPVRHHLSDAGLGTVSEIFDGAPPHLPRGCPSQAWSVACILEAWLRLERELRGRAKVFC